MKTFFKTIAIMTVAGISILAVIGYTVIGESTELKKSADGFFQAVRANQTAQSHHYLSSDFKAITSASELDRLIQQMRLQRATSITWHGFSIHNQNGVLEGLMTLDDATQYTLTVSLSQHAQDWKISGFSVKPAQSVALNRQYSGQTPAHHPDPGFVRHSAAIGRADKISPWSSMSSGRRSPDTRTIVHGALTLTPSPPIIPS